MKTIALSELIDRVGEDLGYSSWIPVTQTAVNQFADCTGDNQWIHVDVERAKAEGPFGGTIAHGCFTSSLIPGLLMQELLNVTGVGMAINYGSDKVRYLAPVPVGADVRLGATIKQVKPTRDGSGYDVHIGCTIEVAEDPDIATGHQTACVAEVIYRFLTAPS